MPEFASWRSYRDFAATVRRTSRFVYRDAEKAFLGEVLRTSQTRVRDVPQNFGLWRAQLGHRWRPEYQDGVYVDDLPSAFLPERMKPLSDRASEGRANPKGIPVLYAATRKQTAMSEVRPWIGAFVSCGYFQTTRPMRVIDLSVFHKSGFNFHFEEPDAAGKEIAVWTDIDQAFSTPTTSEEDSADYAPTQVIAEMFKKEGYDGVVYKSSFGDDGFNFALFDLGAARLTSCVLHKVSKAEFSFEAFENPYFVEEDGQISHLTVEILGPAESAESKTESTGDASQSRERGGP